MKYDLSRIMSRAWELYRKFYDIDFAEALHRSWLCAKAEPINKKRIEEAKQAAGITEPTDTWTGWRKQGFEVQHESRCLFQATLIYGSRGDNQHYVASFFGASQVQALA